jgi:hypothetical protein
MQARKYQFMNVTFPSVTSEKHRPQSKNQATSIMLSNTDAADPLRGARGRLMLPLCASFRTPARFVDESARSLCADQRLAYHCSMKGGLRDTLSTLLMGE